jgi:hypothetical protein
MVLRRKANDLTRVFKIFQRNATDDLIGERELRKILYEYLSQAHDYYITTIIANLKFSRPPNAANFFRQFKLQEIISVVWEVLGQHRSQEDVDALFFGDEIDGDSYYDSEDEREED